jgi:hypothetical protein
LAASHRVTPQLAHPSWDEVVQATAETSLFSLTDLVIVCLAARLHSPPPQSQPPHCARFAD